MFGMNFGQIREFEWDENKRASNLERHGIDFFDVRGVFDGDTLVERSDRLNEERYAIFGILEGEVIVAVGTIRGNRCRWLSARRASRDEREKYHSRVQI